MRLLRWCAEEAGWLAGSRLVGLFVLHRAGTTKKASHGTIFHRRLGFWVVDCRSVILACGEAGSYHSLILSWVGEEFIFSQYSFSLGHVGSVKYSNGTVQS
jgi:hypothetical protein